MDPTAARLAAVLDELVTVLDTVAESRWARWLAQDAAWIRAGDGHGFTHLLTAFGGMGSLSDLSLAEPALDARLRVLRAEAYELAVALRRDASV